MNRKSMKNWLRSRLRLLESRMAYRSDFMIDSFATLAFGFMSIALLCAIFSRIPRLEGWDFHHLLLMFGIGEFTFGLFSIFFFFLTSLPGKYIVEGKLDQRLLRPAPVYLQLMGEGFNPNDVVILAKGVAVSTYALWKLDMTVSLSQMAAVTVLIPAAAAIYASVFTIFASLSFWTLDRTGFFAFLYPISEFSRFPVTIYPLGIRLFLTWVIPFAFVAFYPATVLLGRTEFFKMAAIGPIIAAVFIYIASRIWRRGLMRYESTGT